MAKPKIWSNCDAGCAWETVHKEDFDTYRSMASRFPTPTLNTEKKLTEAGYYYIVAQDRGGFRYSFGVVYWDGSALACQTISIRSENVVDYYRFSIGQSGNFAIDSYTHHLEDVTRNLTEGDRTKYFDFYVAKIVDTSIPTSAEEESY